MQQHLHRSKALLCRKSMSGIEEPCGGAAAVACKPPTAVSSRTDSTLQFYSPITSCLPAACRYRPQTVVVELDEGRLRALRAQPGEMSARFAKMLKVLPACKSLRACRTHALGESL